MGAITPGAAGVRCGAPGAVLHDRRRQRLAGKGPVGRDHRGWRRFDADTALTVGRGKGTPPRRSRPDPVQISGAADCAVLRLV